MLVDTHCHIHEAEYPGGGEAALLRARRAGVGKLICVGTDEKTSKEAVEFAAKHADVWASVGLHPHDAKAGMGAIGNLEELLAAENGASGWSKGGYPTEKDLHREQSPARFPP